jgi:hypothetical protein
MNNMDLNERFYVLVQGVEIAQKKGVLSLENAVEAKSAIDTIQKGEKLKESLSSLASMCELAQTKGIYNLHDAAFLYSAIDGLDAEIEKFIADNTKGQTTTEESKPVTEESKPVTEESKPVTEESTDGIKFTVDSEQEETNKVPVKKSTKKKK